MKIRLKKILDARGMTIPQFAKEIGVEKNTIYFHLRGNPSIGILERWADHLQIDFVELFQEPQTKLQCPHCGKDVKIKLDK